LTTPNGVAEMKTLMGKADMFITNVRLPALVKLGLDYNSVKNQAPHLVYGHLSAWGLIGPAKGAPGYDFGAFWSQTGMAALNNSQGHFAQYPGAFGGKWGGWLLWWLLFTLVHYFGALLWCITLVHLSSSLMYCSIALAPFTLCIHLSPTTFATETPLRDRIWCPAWSVGCGNVSPTGVWVVIWKRVCCAGRWRVLVLERVADGCCCWWWDLQCWCCCLTCTFVWHTGLSQWLVGHGTSPFSRQPPPVPRKHQGNENHRYHHH
jgi:hypothetical protein